MRKQPQTWGPGRRARATAREHAAAGQPAANSQGAARPVASPFGEPISHPPAPGRPPLRASACSCGFGSHLACPLPPCRRLPRADQGVPALSREVLRRWRWGSRSRRRPSRGRRWGVTRGSPCCCCRCCRWRSSSSRGVPAGGRARRSPLASPQISY